MIKRDPIAMIPGPTPVEEPILQALSHQVYGHTYDDFVEIYKEVLKGLREILILDGGEVIAVGGSGTLAMEMALVNTLKKDDNLLIVSHGFFGDRFIEIAKRYGVNADVLTAKPGEVISPNEIDKKLSEKTYQAIIVTHVDTSTGVCAKIRDIGEVLKKYEDTLYIVDGVCATAGIEENMKDWGIDVILTTTQKAFGVPPGIAICGFSDRALLRRKKLGTISNYYCDLELWLPVMHDPSKYFATPPINLILALNEGIKIILNEGLKERFYRHEKLGESVKEGIKALGLNLLAKDGNAAPTLTTVLYPEDNIDIDKFHNAVIRNGVLIAKGVGPLAGKMFRIGHVGNISHQEIILTLSAIEMGLHEVGYKVEFGASVAAAEAVLTK